MCHWDGSRCECTHFDPVLHLPAVGVQTELEPNEETFWPGESKGRQMEVWVGTFWPSVMGLSSNHIATS